MAEADTTTTFGDLAKALANVPYAELQDAARAMGAKWTLTYDSLQPTPTGVFVTLGLFVGATPAEHVFIDRIVIQLPAATAHVTLTAMAAAQVSVNYLLFGRTPPQMGVVVTEQAGRAATPMDEVADRLAGKSASIDMDDEDIVLEEEPDTGPPPPAVPWVPKQRPAPEPEEEELDIVTGTTPDGIPLFTDLYALSRPTEEVIAALVRAIRNYLPKAETVEQVLAVWNKNAEQMDFLKDLGTDNDKKLVRNLLEGRQTELRSPPMALRRRAN